MPRCLEVAAETGTQIIMVLRMTTPHHYGGVPSPLLLMVEEAEEHIMGQDIPFSFCDTFGHPSTGSVIACAPFGVILATFSVFHIRIPNFVFVTEVYFTYYKILPFKVCTSMVLVY